MECNPSKCPVYGCHLNKINHTKLCPIRKSLQILGGKWAIPILVTIQEPKRFGELKRSIADISEKMLIQTLRLLEKENFVKRKDYQTLPPKVVYSLGKKGKQALNLVPTLVAIGKTL